MSRMNVICCTNVAQKFNTVVQSVVQDKKKISNELLSFEQKRLRTQNRLIGTQIR